MAFTMRAMKVSPNSATLEEARNRVFELFRSACRSLPSVMEIYNLDDVVNKSQLRSSIASEFRRNSHVTNPKVIDMLVFKGMEELGNITEHATKRHHIIGQYVVGNHGLVLDAVSKEKDGSDFLKYFYKGNYSTLDALCQRARPGFRCKLLNKIYTQHSPVNCHILLPGICLPDIRFLLFSRFQLRVCCKCTPKLFCLLFSSSVGYRV